MCSHCLCNNIKDVWGITWPGRVVASGMTEMDLLEMAALLD